jgi:hypothetical protein
MKTWMKNGLMVVLALGVLSACSFGNNNEDQEKNETEEIAVLKNLYNGVQGKYEGQIQAVNLQIPVQAWIYWTPVESGKNSRGEALFMPELRFRYRQLDVVQRDQFGKVRFVGSTGEFFSSVKASDNSEATSFEGNLRGDTLQVSVLKAQGKVGLMTLNRVSREIQTSSFYEDTDYVERARAQYSRVKGRYLGEMTATMPGVRSYRMSVEIVGVETATDYFVRAIFAPILETDLGVQRNLNVSIQWDRSPLRITLSDTSSGNQFIVIQGTFDEVTGNYVGTVTDRRGTIGTFNLIRL